MSDRFFVDTNILMYAHDASQGAKHLRALALVKELWQSRAGVISTQVLQELCVNLRRKVRKPLATRAIREILADYSSWHVVVNTSDSILEALEMEERYGVSFWDALIIHSAQSADAEVLYSEDLSAGQKYGSVRVVNPFKS